LPKSICYTCNHESISVAKEKGDAIVSYIRNHNLLRGEFNKASGVDLLSPAETRFGTSVISLDRLNDFKIDVCQTFHSAKVNLCSNFAFISFKCAFNDSQLLFINCSIVKCRVYKIYVVLIFIFILVV
jgi:hypothetical protein